MGLFLPFATGGVPDDGHFTRLLFTMPAGALAAVVLVFLLANTDRSDIPRLLTISALAGVFWNPVIEAGGLWVNRSGQIKAKEEVVARSEEAAQVVADVEAGRVSAAEGSAALKRIAADVNEAVARINDFDLRRQVAEAVGAIVPTDTSARTDPILRDFRSVLTPDTKSRLTLDPAMAFTRFTVAPPSADGAGLGSLVPMQQGDGSLTITPEQAQIIERSLRERGQWYLAPALVQPDVLNPGVLVLPQN